MMRTIQPQLFLLPESFKVGKELSGKQEVKRRVVSDIYKKEIESLYA